MKQLKTDNIMGLLVTEDALLETLRFILYSLSLHKEFGFLPLHYLILIAKHLTKPNILYEKS